MDPDYPPLDNPAKRPPTDPLIAIRFELLDIKFALCNLEDLLVEIKTLLSKRMGRV